MLKFIFIDFLDSPAYRVRTSFYGKEIILDFYWNDRSHSYSLSITDRFGNVILKNKKLMTETSYQTTVVSKILNYDCTVILSLNPDANPSSEKWSEKYRLLIVQN